MNENEELNNENIEEEIPNEETPEENINDTEDEGGFKPPSLSKIKKIGNILLNLIQTLTNPIFWKVSVIIILGFLLITLIISATTVIGQSDFNLTCNYNGFSSVNIPNNSTREERSEIVGAWLMTTSFRFLGDRVMTKEQASGVIGNFIAESEVSPYSIQKISLTNPDYYTSCNNDCVLSWGNVNNKAIGIAQWDGSRRVALVEFAKEKKEIWYDINIQLEFLKYELDNNEGINLIDSDFILLTNTPSEYAKIWNLEFERSANVDGTEGMLNRQKQAEQFYENFDSALAIVNINNCTNIAVDTSNLVQLAIQSSWSSSEEASHNLCPNYLHCGYAQSKQEYIEAKKIAEEKTGKDQLTGLLSSCDRFVATMLRATDTDPTFPWGNTTIQTAYLELESKWIKVSCQNKLPGDVIMVAGKHIMLYVGEINGQPSIASASYLERTARTTTMSCNGDFFVADGYTNGQGWRLTK